MGVRRRGPAAPTGGLVRLIAVAIGSATNGTWAKSWIAQRTVIAGGRPTSNGITPRDITIQTNGPKSAAVLSGP